MKWMILIGAAFISALCLAVATKRNPATQLSLSTAKKTIIRCSPDWNSLNDLLNETEIPPMPGSGNYQWKITTRSDSAQFYFNQGMNMYYGFHIIEALASFKKAARFDPENAMVWWAQALAYGPNINDYGYAASPEALEATAKALSFYDKSSEVEKQLIRAMNERYSSDSSRKREELNQAYADAMKKIYSRFPSHADAAALYADAMMLQHPWDLWNNNGTPKPWTPAIRQVLEKLLSATPRHPGANHYYIHVMEASPYPEKALPSAKRLGNLTPGLSHMVHMPSHIFLRTGDYTTGSMINVQAVSMYGKYRETFSAVQQNAFLYEWHNLHMQANCVLLSGNYWEALKAANLLRSAIDTSALSAPAPIGSLIQYMYMTPVLLNIRFEKWNELLAMEKPSSHHIYARLLYHFGRGMAYAARNNFGEANGERFQLEALMTNEQLKIAMIPFSPAIEGARCASELLQGQIYLHQGRIADAIASFQKAVSTEEKMVYNEPRDWLLNPKPYLGDAYLKNSNWPEAEKAFLLDLKTNNNNIWALQGLRQALVRQNKTREAGRIENRIMQTTIRN